MKCQFCRRPVAAVDSYRLTLISNTGQHLLSMGLHSKCYDKTFEIRLNCLSDMAVPEIRRKAKQRIPLTTVFEAVDPEQDS